MQNKELEVIPLKLRGVEISPVTRTFPLQVVRFAHRLYCLVLISIPNYCTLSRHNTFVNKSSSLPRTRFCSRIVRVPELDTGDPAGERRNLRPSSS
jgi:hypothetical protein